MGINRKTGFLLYENTLVTKTLCLQRCFACEVRVNLNCSTESHLHFPICWNCACAKVTWKPVEAWETTNMAANLAMQKISPFPFPFPFNACHAGYSDDQTLQPTIKMTPGFKTFTLCILLIQICKGVPGPHIPRLLVIVFFLVFFFFSIRPTDRPTDPISGNAFDVKRKSK